MAVPSIHTPSQLTDPASFSKRRGPYQSHLEHLQMEQEQDLQKDIPQNLVSMETLGSPTTPPAKRKKAGSRRTRGGRVSTSWGVLPSPGPATKAEEEMMRKLKELTEYSGGLRNEEGVFTLVMIMKEEKRPLIHERLMEMVLQSGEAILQKLAISNQFLPILHDWMGLYLKNEAWSEVLKKIVRVFGKLPLKKEDLREIKIRFKKLAQHKSEEIKKEAQQALDQWEERQKGVVSAGLERKVSGSLPRLNSWPKRKAGKAYVAVDPDVKSRVKLTRRRSGPLFPGRFLKRSSLGSRGSMPSSPLHKMLHVDDLAPEASHAINKLRMEKQLEEKKEEAPSRLMHSMEKPPALSVFYAQQRALYDELRSEKERESVAFWEQAGRRMEAQIQWTRPCAHRMPPGSVMKPSLESGEKEIQIAREKTVPASDSGLLFTSALEETPCGFGKSPVLEFPFFPRNQEQYDQQRAVLVKAAIGPPSVLGPPNNTDAATISSDTFKN